MKYFMSKLKEVGLSMLPIVLVVLVLHFGFAHFETEVLLKFIGAVVILGVGEVLFLIGIDGSIMKMGDHVGNSINKFSKLFVVLLFAFIFGLVATIAEPDVNVLGAQVIENGININKFLFIFIIGAGVGLFVAFALFRIIKSISYKIVMIAIFSVIFLICIFVPDSFIAIAFDAGGATTGIVTSPFLLALSGGLARNRQNFKSSDNFGVIGIASTGPVLAVLFMALLTGKSGSGAASAAKDMGLLLEVLFNTMLAVLPLVAIFFIFDICFTKIPKKQKLSLLVGSLITFVGLFMFLFGIEFGLMGMGSAVGKFLSGKGMEFAIILAIIFGFIIAFTEPAVKVLGKQVEEVTLGNIKKNAVIISIAVALTAAVTIFTLKIIFGFSIWWIVGIGYGIIVLIMPFSSSTFVSIAFDSGGVASGPMCAAFILPMMIGFASGSGNALEGFGLIATIAMMPVLVLSVLGMIYESKIKAAKRYDYKRALRISYGLDMFSNIEKLEEEYNARALSIERHKEREKEYEEIFANAAQQIKEAEDDAIEG